MTFEEFKVQVSNGQIDTVLVCMIDMQGRLMGKRFHAEAFLEMADGE
ncbi:MAG: glutamine synthetase, partial [Paracoccaceae bacterium]